MSAPSLARIAPSADMLAMRLRDAVKAERKAAAERKALSAAWLETGAERTRVAGAVVSRKGSYERKGSVNESECIDAATLEQVLRAAGMWNKRLATMVEQCKGKAPRRAPTVVGESVAVKLEG